MSTEHIQSSLVPEDILRRVRLLAQERLSLTPEQLQGFTRDTAIVADLQLDSLAQVTLVTAIEDEFGIELELEERGTIITIDDLIRVIALSPKVGD